MVYDYLWHYGRGGTQINNNMMMIAAKTYKGLTMCQALILRTLSRLNPVIFMQT